MVTFCWGIFCKHGSYVLEKPTESLPEDRRSSKRDGVINIPIHTGKQSIVQHPKSPEDEQSIRTAIETNDFIKKIVSKDVIEEVVSAMYDKEVSAEEIVIRQGDNGSHIYVSAKGRYQTIVNEKVVDEFEDVRVFGELAILYNAKRGATIKAMTSGKLWVLDSDLYQRIRYKRNLKEEDETMEFLLNNERLGVIGREALRLVANLLKSEFFPSGKEILKEGDEGHEFYIIRAGTVTITKAGEGIKGVYKEGDSFGEYALLKKVRRQATVTANPPGVECLILTRKEFIRYFGEVTEFKYLKLPPKNSVQAAVATEFADVSLQDLAIKTTLGVGGFGRVQLVQHRRKKELVFALKCLRKSDVVANNQQEHVRYERDIQKRCKSAFIVELYRTFSDDMHIYLLMETCMGGDLWNHMKRKRARRFEETEARFYFACVLEAIGYLHSKEIIYRDLKPENLLLCSNGYIKLADLGTAKKVPFQGKTCTFLGTPEYLAPEIIKYTPYNKAVDYWQCGVLLFDFLCGFTPFRYPEGNSLRVQQNILDGIDKTKFPTFVNLVTRHLIMMLCRPEPSQRLGMNENGIESIKGHKWFTGFNWSRFQELKMTPPFKPKLRGPLDDRYIEKCKKDWDTGNDQVEAIDAQWFEDWDS
ncbi:unnamed protein product [Phaedon cochleariae]|uniref:cGMP-dependent protein kinase n=1 Tax=Phaedon cochleariae TaxID=80249 RepID=A0A9P0GY60_PHACE|nr:unnamed protein product [Phaedon cochleariae]